MSEAGTFPLARLEDVVEILDQMRVPVNGAERLGRTGAVPYYGANGLQGWIDRPLFNEPLILLAEDGGNFDDFASRPIAYRIDGPSWVNNHAHIIRAKDGVSQSFIFWSVVNRDIRKYIAGGTRTKLTQGELRRIEINLPAPSEQRNIAKVLDTLDTAIHETEAIIAKLKAVKQGLLHDLLTRGIDANGELRPPLIEAPHLYKQWPLGWIPKEWELSRIGAEFEIQLGKMLDSQKNAGVLKHYIGNKAVQWDRIDLSEVQQVRLSKTDILRFRLQRGDLLVCEGGEVGRAAIWEDELGECYYQKALHRLRPVRGYRPRLMLELLRYLMSKDALSEYVSKTSIAHLTQEKLAAISLPTPPNDEQDRIVAEILAAKHREEAEYAQLQKFRLLKTGLMDDLLTGRVRVTPLLAGAEREKECA